MNNANSLFNYLPISLQHGHFVNWLQTGGLAYKEPFFDETIAKIKCLPQNMQAFKSISSLEMLQAWSAGLESVKPTAIIFHVSRCGSTLLSQLLGLNSNNIVLAEVPLFDDLLRAGFEENGKDQSSFLSHAVNFYGQKRTGTEQQLFIKTDSWHLFFYDQWRSCYPDVPFVLLYRRPDEVIRSQMKRKGLHAIPGLIEKEIFELGELPDLSAGHENYIAAVLEQYYTKMLSIIDNDALAYLFDYKDGIGSIAQQVMLLSGTANTKEYEMDVEQRLKYDAKEPMKVFSEEPIVSPKPNPQLQRAFELYQTLINKQDTIMA